MRKQHAIQQKQRLRAGAILQDLQKSMKILSVDNCPKSSEFVSFVSSRLTIFFL